MTRENGQTGRRRRNPQRELRAWAERTYLAALERAEARRRELGIAGRMPTTAVAIGLDELEQLLAELARKRPLFAAPRDPRLDPLVRELEAVLAAGRLLEQQDRAKGADVVAVDASIEGPSS